MTQTLGLRASLKTVASAILADVEPGFQPGGKNRPREQVSVKLELHHQAGELSGRQAAARYGRPGGPPLLFKHALKGTNPIKQALAGEVRDHVGRTCLGHVRVRAGHVRCRLQGAAPRRRPGQRETFTELLSVGSGRV